MSSAIVAGTICKAIESGLTTTLIKMSTSLKQRFRSLQLKVDAGYLNVSFSPFTPYHLDPFQSAVWAGMEAAFTESEAAGHAFIIADPQLSSRFGLAVGRTPTSRLNAIINDTYLWYAASHSGPVPVYTAQHISSPSTDWWAWTIPYWGWTAPRSSWTPPHLFHNKVYQKKVVQIRFVSRNTLAGYEIVTYSWLRLTGFSKELQALVCVYGVQLCSKQWMQRSIKLGPPYVLCHWHAHMYSMLIGKLMHPPVACTILPYFGALGWGWQCHDFYIQRPIFFVCAKNAFLSSPAIPGVSFFLGLYLVLPCHWKKSAAFGAYFFFATSTKKKKGGGI